MEVAIALVLLIFCSVDLLLDAGLLTGEITEVEDACAADLTNLVDLDAVNERGLVGENPFNTYAAGYLADSECPGEGIHTLYLDNYSTKLLESLFITFLDSVGHGDCVTGLELRIGGYFLILESLLCNFNQIHSTILLLKCNFAVWLLTRGCCKIWDCKDTNFSVSSKKIAEKKYKDSSTSLGMTMTGLSKYFSPCRRWLCLRA